MADTFSSADKQISLKAPDPKNGPRASTDPRKVLAGLTKDVKKRWMVVFLVIAGGLVVVATTMVSANKKPKIVAVPTSHTIDTTPQGISTHTDWRTQTASEMHTMQQHMDDSAVAQKELLSEVSALRKELIAVKTSSATPMSMSMPGDLTLPAPPTLPNSLAPPAPPAAGTLSAWQGSPGSHATKPSEPFPATVMQPGMQPSMEPFIPKRTPARAFISAVGAEGNVPEDTEGAKEDMVLNEKAGLLPAGSFVAATLISGVEAFTGATAQSTPQPVVIRIDGNAILPNAASYQIKGCHVLASVWGDMSSERVFGRLATLTCVNAQDQLVLSQEVEGNLIDSDGKNGIRGVLQDRQGAKLARSLLAGFAQGMATAFGSAQSTATTGALGTVSTLTGSGAASAAGYQGASNAANSLAKFYMQQAEATMPIIAVDAGRNVSVLFTKSLQLKFDSISSYKTKPKPNIQVIPPTNRSRNS